MNSKLVMTDSERQAYRYGQASSMRRSWSNDSLSSYARAPKTCVCAPTTHPGSFRCKHHRNAPSNLGPGTAQQTLTTADVQHHVNGYEEESSTDQEKSS